MPEFDAQPGRATPVEPESQQVHADEADLYAGMTGVAGIVAGARGLIDTLSSVAEFAVTAMPGVEGAGVALIEPGEGLSSVQTWAATAVIVHEIDTVQYEELNEGPCLTCMQTGRPVVSGSLGSDGRWPRFGGRVARMGVHSALSLPLIVGENVIGAINAYANNRDAFGDWAVRMGTQFAGPAAASVYNAQLLAQAQTRTETLRRALDSRAVIDQAVGILRSRTGATAQEAFDRLVRISQTEQVKLREIAERLVDEAVRRAKARHR
ncbi:GAF and ANTAR domain-containing protein [Mycolicibacterium sp. S2-37]|uniref:GAF and ANTAR domain-containing protein n=1 Tax=Mycolicibacterium sp. S2-37 TaxID=2810297 RepID=UPI001A944A81|nr:GAF and ANTAR domain-containing protein [Mycolicibacterium sp. S2-37]MBO0679066.1 GAF and ANTAR domain-containing protein [Mycolicibacterium sp. S2-37]